MATSFSLVDDHTWLAVDPNTGVVSAVSTTSVSGRFLATVARDIDGVVDNHSLQVSVYKPHSVIIASDIPALAGAVTHTGVNPIKSATHDNNLFLNNVCQAPNGEWHAIGWYTPNQGSSGGMQLVQINMTTGIVTVSASAASTISSNLLTKVLADNGNTYFHAFSQTTPGLNFMKYNPVTEVFTDNIVPALGSQTHISNYKPMCLDPYSRLIYAAAQSEANPDAAILYSLDTTTDSLTIVKTLTTRNTSGVDMHTIGADATHIYLVTGRQPTWFLVSVRKSDGLETVLATEDSASFIIVQQYRRGVVAQFTSTTGNLAYTGHYLFNGVVAGRVDTISQPWTSAADGVPELDGPALRQDEPTYNGDLETPTPDGAVTVFFKYDGEVNWREYNFTVETYIDNLKGSLLLPNGNIFTTGKAYSGFSVSSPNLVTTTRHARLAVSPCPAHLHTNGKVYISGYPSGTSYEYDPTQPWTRDDLSGVTPDTPMAEELDQSHNPRFLGYFDEFSNSHKTRVILSGADGYVYFGGHMMRDGEGGGVEWYHPTTLDHGGVQGALLEGSVYSGCSAGNGRYICLSTVALSPRVNPAIFILDTVTKTIVREVTPSTTPRYEAFSGRLASFNGSDNLFYGINTDLSRGEVTIYSYDASTGAQKWLHLIPNATEYFNLLNYDDYQNLYASDDGYLYVSLRVNAKFILTRVDPVSGGMEVLSENNESMRLVDSSATNLLIEQQDSKSLAVYGGSKLLNNMPPVVISINSVAPIYIDMETRNSSTSFLNVGTDTTGLFNTYDKGSIGDKYADWAAQPSHYSNNLLTTEEYTGLIFPLALGATETLTFSATFDATQTTPSLGQVCGTPWEFTTPGFFLERKSLTAPIYGLQIDGIETALPEFTVGLHHVCATFDRVTGNIRYSIDGGVFITAASLAPNITKNMCWAFGIGNSMKGSTVAQFYATATEGGETVGGVRVYPAIEFTTQGQFDTDFAEAKAVYGVLLP